MAQGDPDDAAVADHEGRQVAGLGDRDEPVDHTLELLFERLTAGKAEVRVGTLVVGEPFGVLRARPRRA